MTEQAYKDRPAYLDGHCAGWLGWACPVCANGVDQQAADRGYWDGCQAREKAIRNAK